ncbi:hypothetical protein DPMN_024453 [Dreissena polymorpha]|uniref:Uncharacterized protein n=1 Tax=Dreissena polymorpha TaxID=45954 RepID=A0A9D4LRG3_DREPO|nr:hypothetical protein DPMN_024453 [Dreissena polymorpha]
MIETGCLSENGCHLSSQSTYITSISVPVRTDGNNNRAFLSKRRRRASRSQISLILMNVFVVEPVTQCSPLSAELHLPVPLRRR